MEKYYRLASTGLSTRELARIAGINHMTVHLLYKKKTTRLTDRVRVALDAVTDELLALVDTGKLPMRALSAAVRAGNVEKIRAYIAQRQHA